MKRIRLDNKKIDQLGKKSFEEIFDISFDTSLSPVIEILASTTNNLELERHLKNYFIIRVVTILEVFFNELVVKLIDEYCLPYKKLFDDDLVQISLSRFEEIKTGKITKGKIIASNFNFQKKEDINKVITNLIGIPFFDKIRNLYRIGTENNKFVQNWDTFFEIVNDRHKLVHTLSHKPKYSVKEMKEIIRAGEELIFLTDAVVFTKIYEISPDILKKKDPTTYGIVKSSFANQELLN